jgi:hypothetical protein
MAFLEMYLNGEWKNLSSFGTVSSVDIQSSSSAISVTGNPITSVGIINLSFNPSAIRLDQFAVPTSNLDINNKNLINVATPTLSHHATNRSYVDSKTWTSSSITDFTTSVTNTAKLISLNQFAVPMASLSMNNYRITSVSDPVNPQDVANKLWVENLIAGGGGSTINLTGSVIGSGTDTIATSFNRFQTIDNVDNTQTWTYNLNVDTGQLVSYHNTILSDTSALIRKFIDRIARKSLTDNQFQWEYDIDTTSISNYQSIKMNFVNGYNNPGTFTLFSANLVNNVITASFNSPLSISNGTLSTHAVTKSQLDNKKLNEFQVNNDVDLGVYKLSTSTAPTQGNHVCNKTFVDSNLRNNIRTGQVVVGDVGGTTGTVALTVSGAILSATKRNGYIGGDSFIDITFADKSYTPFVFVTVNTNTGSSTANDIQVPVVLTMTNTTARLYFEENYSFVQNIVLLILLINPNLS